MDPLFNCHIDTPPSQTSIYRGDLLSEAFYDLLKTGVPSKRIAIIADSNVASLYGRSLKDDLKKRGFSATLFSFPAGEASKNLAVKTQLDHELLIWGLRRDSWIIALGGGVTLDLSAFIASTLLRGIRFAFLPTSLLAMVDAAIGGKCAINHLLGKNLIGTFAFPEWIWIDTTLLVTLPPSEWAEGSVEMIKHALIANASLLEGLRATPLPESPFLSNLIEENIAIKLAFVQSDPFDKGMRKALNFGHTIGHAIEQASDYKVSHGRSIALGMILESFFSLFHAGLSLSDFQQIITFLTTFGLDLEIEKKIWKKPLLKTLLFDKKMELGHVHFSLLERLGKIAPFSGHYSTAIDPTLLQESLNWFEQHYEKPQDFQKLFVRFLKDSPIEITNSPRPHLCSSS